MTVNPPDYWALTLNIVYGNVMTDYISDMEYMRYESVGEYYITG